MSVKKPDEKIFYNEQTERESKIGAIISQLGNIYSMRKEVIEQNQGIMKGRSLKEATG